MPKLCEYCGSSVPDGAKKCPACGAPVSGGQAKTGEKKIDLSDSPSFIKKRDLIVPQIGKNAQKPEQGENVGRISSVRQTMPPKQTPQPKPQQMSQQMPQPGPQPKSTAAGSAQASGSYRPGGAQTSAPVRAGAAAVQTASKPKKSRKGIAVFLALLFLAELGVAAFKYPGFIKKIRTVASDNPYVRVVDTSSEPEAKRLLRSVSPGNPANITIVPDAKKIAKIKPETAAVSPDNPVCKAGDITADFGKWNLEEEDTFEVRPLGTVDDIAGGCKLVMYDFSLASGKHEFTSGVTVTMPRTAGDYDGKVIHWNDESGEWEPTAFEVSEDGKWYTVRLYHFSEVNEAISDTVRTRSSQAERWNLFKVKDKSTDFTFWDTLIDVSTTLEYPILQQLVYFDEGELDLFSHEQAIKDAEYIAKLVKEGRVESDYEVFYEKQALAMFGVASDAAGQAALAGNLKTVGNYAYGIGMALTAYKMLRTFSQNYKGSWFSMTNSAVGSAAHDNMVNSASAMSKVIEENWIDISQALLSTGSYFVSPPTALAFACIGLIYYYLPKAIQYVEDHNPKDYQDAVYRYYLNSHSGGLDKLENFDRSDCLKLNGDGWQDYICEIAYGRVDNLARVQEWIENSLNYYLNSFWTELSFAEREKICKEASEDTAYFVKEPLSAMYVKEMSAGWSDPKKNYSDEYIHNARDILYRNCATAFEAMAKMCLDQMQVNIKKEIYNTVLPLLNEYWIFYAEDSDYKNFLDSPYAKKGTYRYEGNYVFDDKKYIFSYPPAYSSRYSYDSTPIKFAYSDSEYEPDAKFKPANKKDYEQLYSFVPHANFGKYDNLLKIYNANFIMDRPENCIFLCRYYYYLMFGEPDRIIMTEYKDGQKDEPIEMVYKLDVGKPNEVVLTVNNMISKLETARKITPGSIRYRYVKVIPTEARKKEEETTAEQKKEINITCSLMLTGDFTEYSYKINESPKADCSVAIKGDKCTISIAALDFTSEYYSEEYIYSRGAVSMTGTLTDSSDTYMRFRVEPAPSVSGTRTCYKDNTKRFTVKREVSATYGEILVRFDGEGNIYNVEALVGGTGTESFTWDPSWLKALNELAGYEAYENTSKANHSATWYFIPAN